ncbi:hypothetical protein C8F04DRAFT_27703 [Mycena alexandri]|uniref:F-box domain-containing protein n=1 Tax=Mycena alexandri TaxID=1745969 RepID=A0AAD6TEW2_9AGAR|nr:hypothetical protein C8F04DRAFT_27703 [Mycena alexandri]
MSTLEADRSRLRDLDAQILELKHSLSTLRTTKAQVQKRLDSYKYPVLTLPNEMVSEFFIHFLPAYPLCPPLTGRFSPMTLTQVCGAWRGKALSTPSLWRAISLSFHSDLPPLYQRHEADAWVRRSHSLPIAVEILDATSANRSDNESEVLATLAAHRACCEHLTVHLETASVVALQGPMPRLRHLDLDFHYEHSGITDFSEAPLLRTVALDYVAARMVLLPWAQITSLTLDVVSPMECDRLLRQTPNLTHCHLRIFVEDEGGDDGPPPDVTLAYLDSLTLVTVADPIPAVNGYLGTFIVPALRRLKISEDFLGSDPLALLASFLSKSSCKLQDVDIGGERILPECTYREAFPLITFSFEAEEVDSSSNSE